MEISKNTVVGLRLSENDTPLAQAVWQLCWGGGGGRRNFERFLKYIGSKHTSVKQPWAVINEPEAGL